MTMTVAEAHKMFVGLDATMKRLRDESSSRRWSDRPNLAYKAGAAQQAAQLAEEALRRFEATLLAMMREADETSANQ